VRTCGVTPSARRGAAGREASRPGRPRRQSRCNGGSRSSKPGPVGFRRGTWLGPRSGPWRTAGHQPLPHGRSGPFAAQGAWRYPGEPRPRRGRREPRSPGGAPHPPRGAPWDQLWRPRDRARGQRVSACRRHPAPWRRRADTRSPRKVSVSARSARCRSWSRL